MSLARERQGNGTEADEHSLKRPAHALSVDDVVNQIKANPDDGLNPDEADRRHEIYGPNELDNGLGVQPVQILIRQISNAMILVLFIAMIVSFAIGSWIEGGVITAVIVLNVVVGFFQEFRAEQTMDSLRSMSSPTACAVRGGKSETIPTAYLVPGDLVDLKTGDTVPADLRLFDSMNLETDEALLTGESLPVQKVSNATFNDGTGVGDRLNIAFSSSSVTRGRARGIVFATGMQTEIGQIATALQQRGRKTRQVKRKADGTAKAHRYIEAWALTCGVVIGHFLGVRVGTPLQRRLSWLAIMLFAVAVVFAIVVLAANGFVDNKEVIIYAVATGLSMIPASLVVVLTITMAAGTKQMAKRNVVVRKHESLEALGGVTDICSDKTGTLTQGKMVVKKAWIPSQGTYIVNPGEPFNPSEGDIKYSSSASLDVQESVDEKGETKPYNHLLNGNTDLENYFMIASLANLAIVHHTEDGWKARGDPTEIAIQVFACRFDMNRERLTKGDKPQWSQIAEYPFDSAIKKMSVIFKSSDDQPTMVFTKGAVERVLESCTRVKWNRDSGLVDLTDSLQEQIIENMDRLTSQGLRVLALASKPLTASADNPAKLARAEVERDLTFHGLIGLYDPPRPESAGAVAKCHEAGIAVHMLTGDHPGTARAIAAQIGIIPADTSRLSRPTTDGMVTTAAAFDALSEAELDAIIPRLPLVVARCSPATKVRMMDALHRRRRVVAMTGDGVNNSPALRRADVGIAMGRAGSDVAKQAAAVVLADDDFASILAAVEEGRRMADNVRRFVLHLLAQNAAQAATLLAGLAFKDARGLSVFPLSPVEILWVVMVTSSLPDMGLGFEPADPDVLRRPPRAARAALFSRELVADVLAYGALMAALCLSAFAVVLLAFGSGLGCGQACNESIAGGCDEVFRARATTFVCMTWFSLFLAWEMTSLRGSFFSVRAREGAHPATASSAVKQWARDLWRKKFLFWSVVAGFITVFPTLYLPVINRVVFKHEGISWEWGVVFVEAVLFFVGVESWKWGKRIYFRRVASSAGTTKEDVEGSRKDLFPSGSNAKET